MGQLRFIAGLLAVPLLLADAFWTNADARTIVLQDHLRTEWKRELVSFPLAFPKGACVPGSVQLRGPRGDVPCQLSRVVFWPDGAHVKEARLSFETDLAPLAKDAYVLSYGPKPVESPRAETDLSVSRGDDGVEITTSHFGVRLLLGRNSYSESVAAKDVPGPVMAIRKPDGGRFGGSRMYGDKKIVSYSSEIIEQGPVFVQVETTYTFEGGVKLRLSFEIAAGDSQVLIDDSCDADLPRAGWELLLSPGAGTLTMHEVPGEFGACTWGVKPGETIDVVLSEDNLKESLTNPVDPNLGEFFPRTITNLTPWADWWSDRTQTDWIFKSAGGEEILRVAVRNPGAWVKPKPTGVWASSERRDQKMIPLVMDRNREVFMRVSALAGHRAWAIGVSGEPLVADSLRNAQRTTTTARIGKVGRRLDVVKDYVLDWPEDPDFKHPRLYASRSDLEKLRKERPADKELVNKLLSGAKVFGKQPYSCTGVAAWLLTGSPEVAARGEIVEQLRHYLGLFGRFDKMRYMFILVNMYDGLIDSGLLSPEERRVMRARMAYLGYLTADPWTWSIERGYCSGNPNMTMGHILGKGMIGNVLPGHPEANRWAGAGVDFIRDLPVTERGRIDWSESINYTQVSLSSMVPFAIAATNAGHGELVNYQPLKELVAWVAKLYSPPDLREWAGHSPGTSVDVPFGRGGGDNTGGLFGLMARAMAESDPAYSRAMQRAWRLSGCSQSIKNNQFSGFEHVYMDPTLPAETPDWTSENLENTGVLMRHGLGSKDEYYIMVESHYSGSRKTGAFAAWYAKGVPLTNRFLVDNGYRERMELLLSGVLKARNRGAGQELLQSHAHRGEGEVTAFSALPRQDYARIDCSIGEASNSVVGVPRTPLPEWPPLVDRPAADGTKVTWWRQMLFVKDIDPAGVNYLVLRDTIEGDAPTMWQFWSHTEKIGTPEEAKDMETFLVDKPGEKTLPPRKLDGRRFTAAGQFGVDLEYYVASPTDTPIHTLRWGQDRGYGEPPRKEHMDLLHLQLAGDGHYFVVLYPRRRSEAVPSFETLGDGKVVKVVVDSGTDYAFLSRKDCQVEAETVKFSGTAGSVQDRGEELTLSLGAKGEIQAKGKILRADIPVGMLCESNKIIVVFDNSPCRRHATLAATGSWRLADGTPSGVQLCENGENYTLSVPEGVKQVTLLNQ